MMLNKMKEKERQQQKDTAETGDPYYMYGFGLLAYRNTLFTLCMAFVAFSILALPIVNNYSSG